MTRILISAVIACGLSGALGQLLIPMLRALKPVSPSGKWAPPGIITRLAPP